MVFDGGKACVFDMDGVLLDTESLCKKCWRRAARDFCLKDIDEVFYKCVGQARQDTFKTLQDFFIRQKSDFDARTFYLYAVEFFKKEEALHGIPLKKGARECLERLSSEGVTLALASSTRTEVVKRQLNDAGLLKFFKTITCGDSVLHSKPDPEIYLKACASIAMKAEDCYAVEDSINGVRSAYSAGLKVIMVPDLIEPDEETVKLCKAVIPSLDEFNLSPD